MTAQILAEASAWSDAAAFAFVCLGALLLTRATRQPLWTTFILMVLLARGSVSMLHGIGIGIGAARPSDLLLGGLTTIALLHLSRPRRLLTPVPAVVPGARRPEVDANAA